MAVDAQGSIYLSGSTSSVVPTTPGVVLPGRVRCPYPCSHAWVAKIASSGDRIEWASYVTPSPDDSATAIAVARDGSLYVGGIATIENRRRLFLRKLAADGKSILGATDFGGSGEDAISKLTIDAAGDVYVAGTTASADFPTTPGAFQRTLGSMPPSDAIGCHGDTDQFVARFDAGLQTMMFSTLIGTPAAEQTTDLAVGGDGSVFVAGTRTPERNSPCTAALLTRLNPRGSAAVYSLFLPGARGYAVAVDPVGTAYLASDNRPFGIATPEGVVIRVDAQGKVAASGTLAGHIHALSYVDGEIGAIGSAWPMFLPPLKGPGNCQGHIRFDSLPTPYFARLSPSTLAAAYVGYLSADVAWLAAPDRLVATNPYSTLLPYGVLPAGPPMPGTVTCVVNAASFQPEAVSPGELISIFGKEIGGVQVTANGLPAPLLYVSPDQINLVAPFGLSGDKVRFELRRGVSLVSQFDKRLAPYHPGIFATGRAGVGQLAALNQDGSINSQSNPATPGSIMTVFATGLGAMTPPLPDGATATEPVNTPETQFEVLVNGARAEIRHIGNAPYLVQGVVQINFRLPEAIPLAFGAQPGQPYVGITLSECSQGGVISGGTVVIR